MMEYSVDKHNNVMNCSHETDETDEGFVALVSVIIVGAIAIAVVLALLLFGISSVQNAEVFERSAKARYMADACAEYALERLREDPSYSGSETVEIGGNSCEILSVEHISEGAVAVSTIGTSGDAVRKVRVITSRLRPSVRISLWEEVGEL
jgi:type II secretory pathway component PulK